MELHAITAFDLKKHRVFIYVLSFEDVQASLGPSVLISLYNLPNKIKLLTVPE